MLNMISYVDCAQCFKKEYLASHKAIVGVKLQIFSLDA